MADIAELMAQPSRPKWLDMMDAPTVGSTGGTTPVFRETEAGNLIKALMGGGLVGASGQEQPGWSQLLNLFAHVATDTPGAGGGLGAILGPGARSAGGMIKHDILSQGQPVGNISLRENPGGLYVENIGAGPNVGAAGAWTRGTPNNLGTREMMELLQ